MKCLIIDKVYAGIAEELSKYMEVKTAENLPSTKDQLLAEIGDFSSADATVLPAATSSAAAPMIFRIRLSSF